MADVDLYQCKICLRRSNTYANGKYCNHNELVELPRRIILS